ncbi:MAG: sigma-70 family RNA polymerase sigma factor [Pyrinomonadaceae bacterium]
MVDSQQITQLLKDWSDGEQRALDDLLPLVYEELRRIAKRQLKKQHSGHTFQTTELIHEAYLKLAGKDDPNWKNRAHFFGVAAKAMRHILVDYARAKGREKRGGWQQKVTLGDDLGDAEKPSQNIVALDDALQKLSSLEERKSKVVELKFFGGMTFPEIANVLDISEKTAKRDWRFARMWLLREMALQ